MIETNVSSAQTIYNLAQSLRHITRNVGGEIGVTHCGVYNIHFLSAIPSGFIEGLDPTDMSLLYEHPMLLCDFDAEAFLHAANDAGLYRALDSCGLVVEETEVCVVGFSEKEGRILSYGIADALGDLLELESPTRYPANALLLRCMPALEYSADRDAETEETAPDEDLHDEVLDYLKTVFSREELKGFEKYHA